MERIEVDKGGEESIVSGHLWIFSNQVRRKPSSLPDGGLAEIRSERGRLLGVGTYNSKSLIAVRLLARESVRVAEAAVKSAQSDLERAEARQEEGQAVPSDLMSARVQLAQAQEDLLQA